MTRIFRALGVLLAPTRRDASTCGACGNAFTCGATILGCWCTKINLAPSIRTALRGRYSDCLCPECLENFASGESKIDVIAGKTT